MHQEFEKRLYEALVKQTEKIKHFCNQSNILPNVAVHETRKSFKRLRALLQLYNGTENGLIENAIKTFKQHGRNISPMRESFVNLQLFDKISDKNSIQDKKIKQVKEILIQKNKMQLFDWKDGKNFQEKILAFVEKFENELILSENAKISSAETANLIHSKYLNAFTYYHQINAETSGDEWHELRKMLKNFWYKIEFLKYLHPRYLNPKADQLNQITEQLGEEHDLYILGLMLKNENLKLDSYVELVLKNKVEHLRQIIQVKLSPRLRQFFSEDPEVFKNKIQNIFQA